MTEIPAEKLAKLLWDNLRFVACSSRPHTNAKTIVQLKYTDVKKACQMLELELNKKVS